MSVVNYDVNPEYYTDGGFQYKDDIALAVVGINDHRFQNENFKAYLAHNISIPDLIAFDYQTQDRFGILPGYPLNVQGKDTEGHVYIDVGEIQHIKYGYNEDKSNGVIVYNNKDIRSSQGQAGAPLYMVGKDD